MTTMTTMTTTTMTTTTTTTRVLAHEPEERGGRRPRGGRRRHKGSWEPGTEENEMEPRWSQKKRTPNPEPNPNPLTLTLTIKKLYKRKWSDCFVEL